MILDPSQAEDKDIYKILSMSYPENQHKLCQQ